MPAINLPAFSTQTVNVATPIQVAAPNFVSCWVDIFVVGPGSVYVSDQPVFALGTAYGITPAQHARVFMYGQKGLYINTTSDATIVSFAVTAN